MTQAPDPLAPAPDILWSRAEVESPCVKVCVIHPAARLCVGCLRTIDEISAWSALSPARRSEILAELPGRAGTLTARRGGAQARRGDPG